MSSIGRTAKLGLAIAGVSLLALTGTASAAVSSYGTWFYDNGGGGTDKNGSRASINTQSTQQPAYHEIVLHRVFAQGANQANPPGFIQIGIYRTDDNTNLIGCGESPSAFHKFSERVIQNGTTGYLCQRFSSADGDIPYSVYRTPTNGQWRVEVNGSNVLGTYNVNFQEGYAAMGSEITSPGPNFQSQTDELYCRAKNWNVFNDPSENNPVVVDSNSKVAKYDQDSTGWTYGDLPCEVHIRH